MTDKTSKGQYEKWTQEIASKIDTAEIMCKGEVVEMATKKVNSGKDYTELQQVTAVKKSLDIDNVFKCYKVNSYRRKDVVRFLKSNTDIIPILVEVESGIINIFGQTSVYLQLDRDPEEGFEQLFGMIQVNQKVDKALTLLKQFDQESSLSLEKDSGYRLNFDVEIIE